MKTYDCPRDGVPKRDRRKHPRNNPDPDVEQMFNGFHNVIENLVGDVYLQGYVQAMMIEYARQLRVKRLLLRGEPA